MNLSGNSDIILNMVKNIKLYTMISPIFTDMENSVINDSIVPNSPKNDITIKNTILKTLLRFGYDTCIVLLIFKPLSKDCNSRRVTFLLCLIKKNHLFKL